MVQPLHLGLEHPNLIWILATGLLAFVAGLGVNLYRSWSDDPADAGVADESAE